MATGKVRMDDSNAVGDARTAIAAVPFASGVHIEHERPAPDTEPHVIAPLIIALTNGTRLIARKWSLRGISDVVLAGHDLTGARLEIPFQGIEIGFPVRLDRVSDTMFWAFHGLTGRQREALGLFYRNLMTGKMAATDEVITALDTPVDLIPMGETEAEKSSGTARSGPRALRVVWNVVYYVALFGVIAGYLGSMVWKRLDHVALANARYVAPFTEIAAPGAGFVTEVVATQGAGVLAGDLLVRMTDPEAEAALAEVRGLIAQAEARLADGAARVAAHLHGRDAARVKSPDAVQFDAGVSVLPGDFHDIRQRLDQEARLVDLELRALRSERGRLRDRARALEIHAPADGRVERVLVQTDSFLRVGTPVLSFEANTPRMVLGWLDATEAASVWQGMRATVRFSVGGTMQSLPATVASIEAGSDPLRPDSYGLLVYLDLAGLDLAQSRTLLPHNTAIEVRLHRDLAQRWFGIGE